MGFYVVNMFEEVGGVGFDMFIWLMYEKEFGCINYVLYWIGVVCFFNILFVGIDE